MKKKNLTLSFGMFLLICYSANAQDSLFISEVTDPADDYAGRFIELYNAGSETIDFSSTTLYLSRQSNGGTGWGDLQLAGTVAPKETFLIGGSSFEAIYGFPPNQESGIHIGNGDDAWFLYLDGDHLTGTLHDIYGVIDIDGTGEDWEYEDSRAVRIQGISHSNPQWSASEWEISAANIADCDPGTHHGLGGEGEDFSLALLNDTVHVGEEVEVPVSVNTLSASDNIISYQFDIEFDPASLEYTGYSLTATLAEGGTLAVNDVEEGKLSVSFMHTAPLVGSGEILKLRFSSMLPDTTIIAISNAYLNNQAVLDLVNGTVISKSLVPPTALITYNDSLVRFADTLNITATFSQAMDASYPVHISFSGAVTLSNAEMIRQNALVYSFIYQVPRAEGEVSVMLSNGRDQWGNEVLPLPAGGGSFDIIRFHPGDVDDDGTVMAYDAALALQHSVGLDPIPLVDPLPWEAWRDSTADVDGSGQITAYDAGMILQFSAGIITSLSGSQAKSLPTADVSAKVVGDQVIFYSHGSLLGLNISTTMDKGTLGQPVVLGENLASPFPGSYLTAFNNSGSSYRVGLCTTSPPSEGAAILRIPIQTPGVISFDLLVNGFHRFLSLDPGTGMKESRKTELLLYPNPATDRLFIRTSDYFHQKGYRLRVTNLHGTSLFESRITGELLEADLSGSPGTGLICVQVTSPTGEVVATRKVILH